MNELAVLTKKRTGFEINPRNMDEAMRFAKMISNSQLAPKDFKGKPEDTFVAMLMGNELGLNPLQSLQNIAVINGRPSIWGDAMLALVQTHPAFGSIEETLDEATMTAKCTVTRKGGVPHTVTFSREDAIRAGLWQSEKIVKRKNKQSGQWYETENDSPWYRSPKRMLAMRARGFALRNQFADALLGLITREEAMDYTPEEKDITPVSDPEDTLPTYTDEAFKTNVGTWQLAINKGKKTPQQILSTIRTKYTVPSDMEKKILDLRPLEEAAQ